MKKRKTIFLILMLLPLLAILAALLFLPEEIPAHYGFDGQVDRWGSKYETLIFPALTISFGLFMLLISKISAKQEKTGTNNEKICIITGIICLLLFNALTGYYLYMAFHNVKDLFSASIDVNQVEFTLLGILLIVVGNMMPKARLNSVMGLRTSWSMKNEVTWRKSQRFGGITFMIVGILMIAACCFTKGFTCCLLSMGLLIASIPVDIYYTYRIAKKYANHGSIKRE